MNTLLIVLGLVAGMLAPLIRAKEYGASGILYYAVILCIMSFVFAFVFLSMAKSANAKLDLLRSQTIIAWTDEPGKERVYLPWIVALIASLIVGTFIIIRSFDYLPALTVALFVGFTGRGWYGVARSRIRRHRSGMPSFILSHIGLLYRGKASLFDGYHSGISEVRLEKNDMVISILRGKKSQTVTLPVPPEKKDEAEKVIAEMKEYFAQNGEG